MRLCSLHLTESEETLLVWIDVESWKQSEKGESLWAGAAEVWAVARLWSLLISYKSQVVSTLVWKASSGFLSLSKKTRGLINVVTAPVMWPPMTSHTFMQFLKLWPQGLYTCCFFCWGKNAHMVHSLTFFRSLIKCLHLGGAFSGSYLKWQNILLLPPHSLLCSLGSTHHHMTCCCLYIIPSAWSSAWPIAGAKLMFVEWMSQPLLCSELVDLTYYLILIL